MSPDDDLWKTKSNLEREIVKRKPTHCHFNVGHIHNVLCLEEMNAICDSFARCCEIIRFHAIDSRTPLEDLRDRELLYQSRGRSALCRDGYWEGQRAVLWGSLRGETT